MNANRSAPTAKRNLAAFGVMLVIFLFAIDATIVSTSMPTIVAKLGGLELYSWVFSIYMLTSALTTPIFGKLADLYSKRTLDADRHRYFSARLDPVRRGPKHGSDDRLSRHARVWAAARSTRCRLSSSALIFPADQRAKMQGIISGIWGLASILGPLAGGVIVEHWSWRWIFFVNLPLIADRHGSDRVGLKEESAERRAAQARSRRRVHAARRLAADILRPGPKRPRAPPAQRRNHELSSLAGLAVLMVFYFIERRAAEPILPLDLFHIGLYKSAYRRSPRSAPWACSAPSATAALSPGRHRHDRVARRHGISSSEHGLDRRQSDRRPADEPVRLSLRRASTGMILLAAGYGLFLRSHVRSRDHHRSWIQRRRHRCRHGYGDDQSHHAGCRPDLRRAISASALRHRRSCCFVPSAELLR